MKKLRLVVCGGKGRMGQEIVKLAKKDYKIIRLIDDPEDFLDLTAKEVDVVIDFSSPQGLLNACRWCVKNKIPLVSGTTGLSAGELRKLQLAGKKIPLLWAANMSFGVALLKKMLSLFSVANEFQFQIEEFHHIRKKDAPSGTAKALYEQLSRAIGKKQILPIVSVRGGGIFGIHKVHAMAEEETITLEHVALNRAVFARGALRAAQWLVKKRKGYYTFDNVVFGER